MPDQATQQYVQQMRNYALGATGLPTGGGGGAPQRQGYPLSMGYGGGAGALGVMRMNQMQGQSGNQATPFQMPGLPPDIAAAQDQFRQYAQGGNLGFSALTGDADAAQRFLNPYTQAFNPFWAQQRQQAVGSANEQATLAGAFGGDRSQIGAAAAGNFVDQNQTAAQIQAFEEAMRRAGFASQLGFGAQAQSAMLPGQYYGQQLGLLNQGLGPYGQTQTTKTQSDPFSQIAGLGLTLFGPGGLLAGAGAGASAALPMVI